MRVPLGRLVIMQPDPERVQVLYAEPDLRTPDGQRLVAVCGTYFLQQWTLSFLSSLLFFSLGEGHTE